MPRYGVKTDKSPNEAIDETIEYFGEPGLGMTISFQSPYSVTLEGGGGFVTVVASEKDEETEVEITTREWDYHVKKFMEKVG